ncbi:MAG: BrnA antitoxin family protein [Rhizobiaceae bacterium]
MESEHGNDRNRRRDQDHQNPRPPSGKIRVTMLLKPETVEKFKAAGKGWQARMSDILDRNAP